MDESGAAWRREQGFLVGGLLVPGRPTRRFAAELEARLRASAPGVAWPPHAHRIGVAAERIEGVARGAAGCSARAEAAAESVGRSSHPAVEAWRRSLKETGGESSWGALRGLDGWLQTNRHGDWHALGSEARRVEQGLLEALRATRGAIAVACVDPPSSDVGSATDRYLRVLQGLFERVVRLLKPGDQLLVRPAMFDRDLDSGTLGRVNATLGPGFGGRVTVALARPESYRDGLHPGLVLADLVANRLRRHVRGAWSTCVRRVDEALGVPVEVETLPAIAADGPPRRSVARVAAGEGRDAALAVLPEDYVPTWAREQALAWVHAIGEVS